jgi:predicted transcriptional regulator
MAEITEDQPTTTPSTIVRNLEEKGYVAHNAYGNTHHYPIVPIEDYRKRFMSTAIDTYFNSSYKIWCRFSLKKKRYRLLN